MQYFYLKNKKLCRTLKKKNLPETAVDYEENRNQEGRHLTGIHKGICPGIRKKKAGLSLWVSISPVLFAISFSYYNTNRELDDKSWQLSLKFLSHLEHKTCSLWINLTIFKAAARKTCTTIKGQFKNLVVIYSELTRFRDFSLKLIKIALIAATATLHVNNSNLFSITLLMFSKWQYGS